MSVSGVTGFVYPFELDPPTPLQPKLVETMKAVARRRLWAGS
ncbi:hypothetical protein P3H15_55005 [Rhodococcus sp. T2V]|nr:hypothetical protein [Rhodococcus sp. T2V]MDF3313945.1 hypothetical protein [Rhodococcus sp. T2V]